jgi:hypothetical protein
MQPLLNKGGRGITLWDLRLTNLTLAFAIGLPTANTNVALRLSFRGRAKDSLGTAVGVSPVSICQLASCWLRQSSNNVGSWKGSPSLSFRLARVF